MRVGKLRHRLLIQEREDTSWSDVAYIWAARETNIGQERFENSDLLLQDEEILRFRARYRADITHKMRVIWNERTFDIQRIEEPDNFKWEMILVCLEVPNDS